jgi:hypothetical protein
MAREFSVATTEMAYESLTEYLYGLKVFAASMFLGEVAIPIALKPRVLRRESVNLSEKCDVMSAEKSANGYGYRFSDKACHALRSEMVAKCERIKGAEWWT